MIDGVNSEYDAAPNYKEYIKMCLTDKVNLVKAGTEVSDKQLPVDIRSAPIPDP